MDEISAVLLEAADVLEKKGKARGILVDEMNGHVCVLGAFGEALGLQKHKGVYPQEWYAILRHHPAVERLAKHLRNNLGFTSGVLFSDVPVYKWSDVTPKKVAVAELRSLAAKTE